MLHKVMLELGKNVVLFMGTDTEEAPLERHLYAVPLRSPSSSSSSTASIMQPIKLTETRGVHSVTVNHTLDRAIDVSVADPRGKEPLFGCSGCSREGQAGFAR